MYMPAGKVPLVLFWGQGMPGWPPWVVSWLKGRPKPSMSFFGGHGASRCSRRFPPGARGRPS